MASQYSPFLHRQYDPAPAPYRDESQQTYAEKIIPSAEAQRALIEKFRYHMYQRAGTLGVPMKHMREWIIRNLWWIGPLIYSSYALHGVRF